MTEKWIDVRIPKDALYGMIFLFVSCLVLFIIGCLIEINKVSSGIRTIYGIGILIFILCVGWGTPLYIYSLIPKFVSINENKLFLKSRIGGKTKKYTKEQILKVRLIKSFMSGEILCQIFYGIKQNDLVTIDYESGKKVYDWYYGHKDEDGPRPIKNYYWRDKKKK